ncbi:MAG: hypothetical protein V4598_04840 [Bdellovibrionota bacterium]
MTRLFTVLILLMSGLSAYAQSCSTVDLRTTPGGRALGEVRNQGGMGWCASFVTADLISYRQRRKISGLGVAIHWTNRTTDFETRRIRTRQGTVPVLERASSHAGNVMRSSIGRFQCLESDLPSDDNALNTLRGTLERVAEVKRQFDKTHQCSAPSIQTVRSMFPRLSAADVTHILQISALQDVHKNLLYRNCRDKYVSVENVQLSFSKNWNNLDAQLTRGNLVAFGYNSNVLKNSKDMSAGIGHTSTLVGRRMRNGQCEYLVRNSWGRSCGYYDKAYPCEQGNIWVPKGHLSRSASDFFYYP